MPSPIRVIGRAVAGMFMEPVLRKLRSAGPAIDAKPKPGIIPKIMLLSAVNASAFRLREPIILLVALLLCGCRHLDAPPIEAWRTLDKETKHYVFVYTPPEKNDPAGASLLKTFNSPDFLHQVKAVVDAETYKETNEPEKLFVLGTTTRNPLLQKSLLELGVELSEGKITLSGRTYVLAPYAFTAHYETEGRRLLLTAVASYKDLVEMDSLDEKVLPQLGSYALFNADCRVVEGGEVRKLGPKWKLNSSRCECRGGFQTGR